MLLLAKTIVKLINEKVFWLPALRSRSELFAFGTFEARREHFEVGAPGGARLVTFLRAAAIPPTASAEQQCDSALCRLSFHKWSSPILLPFCQKKVSGDESIHPGAVIASHGVARRDDEWLAEQVERRVDEDGSWSLFTHAL